MHAQRPPSRMPRLEILEDRLTPSGPGGNNPGVLPPQSNPFGATYGEWAARWWQWAYKQPVDTNPLFDETGARIANGQSGKVWFLAGVINVSGSAVRTGTVPAGKALFFPILNFEADNLAPPMDPPLNEAGLRALAKANIDGATDLRAEVDGRSITNLPAYRVQSPVFSITFPNNNIFQFFGFNVPAGTYSMPDGFVDDGYYLMLSPLSAGHHDIHFHGSVPDFGFTLDITYHLNVVGGNSSLAAAGLAGNASRPAAPASARGPAVDLSAASASFLVGSSAKGGASVAEAAPSRHGSAAAAQTTVAAPPHPATSILVGGPTARPRPSQAAGPLLFYDLRVGLNV